AQIIDLMMLVVDVVKGVQTQTAECLLIGELTCPRMGFIDFFYPLINITLKLAKTWLTSF
ncbi:hypothetical protein XENOCAPTIV_025578, partial [Xenoophorus captivus]